MHAKHLYESIYRYWADTTPLFGDCGKLCGKACCESHPEPNEEEAGMYLFPGEKALFSNTPGFRIVSSDFTYGKNKTADIVICTEPCLRGIRPLSCRIFPLIPYFRTNSGLKIIIDPRAKQLCPLAQKKAISHLNPAFILKTEKTFRLLIQFSEVRAYLEGLSDILDDFLKFQPVEDIL